MQPKLKVLQVIPRLGYGGAETGCYDIAHYLPENNVKSYLITSGGELLKFIDGKKLIIHIQIIIIFLKRNVMILKYFIMIVIVF